MPSVLLADISFSTPLPKSLTQAGHSGNTLLNKSKQQNATHGKWEWKWEKKKQVFVILHSSVFTLSYYIIRTAAEAAGSIKIENEIKLRQKPSFYSSFHDTVETAFSSINNKCFLCSHLFFCLLYQKLGLFLAL